MQSEKANKSKEVPKLISFLLSKRAQRVIDVVKDPLNLPKGRKKK